MGQKTPALKETTVQIKRCSEHSDFHVAVGLTCAVCLCLLQNSRGRPTVLEVKSFRLIRRG